LKLLMLLTRTQGQAVKIKDIISKADWDKVLADLEEHAISPSAILKPPKA